MSAVPAAVEMARPTRAPLRPTVGLLVVPLVVLLTTFYVYPVASMLAHSVTDPSPGLQQYQRLIDHPVYLNVLWRTFRLAVLVTFATAIVGFPVAFYLTVAKPAVAQIALSLLFVPFWASTVVRTYALMVLLGRTGVINGILMWSGLVVRPIQFLFSAMTVQVAMVQILLPFFVLPLYGVLRTIDGNLLQAAGGLGAKPLQVFRRIYLPLSLPGLFAGGLMVFVFCFGFFITPTLLGGRHSVTIAMLIMSQFEGQLDWGFGAALSTVLLAVTLAAIVIALRVTRGAGFSAHG
jgi:ABC-type spermidine/putrescine transport system permease subunit I